MAEGVSRFLLFACDSHDANGGWDDYVGEFGSLDAAKAGADGLKFEYAHVVELPPTAEGKVVASGYQPDRPMRNGEYTAPRPPWVWTDPDRSPYWAWRSAAGVSP